VGLSTRLHLPNHDLHVFERICDGGDCAVVGISSLHDVGWQSGKGLAFLHSNSHRCVLVAYDSVAHAVAVLDFDQSRIVRVVDGLVGGATRR